MTTRTHTFFWLAPYAMALASLLAADALAQGSKPVSAVTVAATAATTEDMRLWSFGDCDRRFPYINTDAHMECVRVVGSAEARDARALRVCETSNGSDREEAERCKTAYRENKQKAAQETLAASSPAGAVPPPSAEVMRRVKAITSAAVEERAAVQSEAPAVEEPAAAQVQDQSESSSFLSTTSLVLLIVALAGIGATVMRRKQAQSA
jgi:hypothetical protein